LTSTDTTSDTGSSTTAAQECTPDDTQPCYSGPPGTESVGLCAGGQRTCGPGGSWGDCVGEVVPASEDCDSPGDEDCDGVDACAVEYPWSKSVGGIEWEHGRRVAIDAAGNVVMMVNASGKTAIDFGGGELPGMGGRDVSIVKFAPDGAHLWSKRFAVGVSFFATGWSIAVDDDGRIALVGDYDTTLDFGGGPIASLSDNDGFVAVFDPDGAHLWSTALRTGTFVQPLWAAFDGAGDLVVTGRFLGWIDLGGEPLQGLGDDDVFLVKFDAAGAHQWSIGFGDAGVQSGLGVVTDAAGDIYVGGSFEGVLDPGSGPLVSAGDEDIFLARFDPEGVAVWGKRWGGALEDRLFTLTIDGEGHLGFGGESYGGLDLGDGPLAPGLHQYVAEVDGDGAPQWSRRISPGQTGLQAVAYDGAGALFVTGGLYGDGNDFGGGPLVSQGQGDIFLVKLDGDGQHVWSRGFGDPKHQAPAAVAASATGVVAISGELSGAVDFGDGLHMVAGNFPQAFVAVFGP
jgi:hypothetical protein